MKTEDANKKLKQQIGSAIIILAICLGIGGCTYLCGLSENHEPLIHIETK